MFLLFQIIGQLMKPLIQFFPHLNYLVQSLIFTLIINKPVFRHLIIEFFDFFSPFQSRICVSFHPGLNFDNYSIQTIHELVFSIPIINLPTIFSLHSRYQVQKLRPRFSIPVPTTLTFLLRYSIFI